MAITLTDQQKTAVENSGGQLLVSAAAGSGKTKVLVERLLRGIREGGNVDDFLIITYTKAAAAELRGKIARELADQVAAAPDDRHLRQQLYRVYCADIKTVDAFCASLLRENVHLLEPIGGRSYTADFRALDEQEAAVLQQHVLEDTLERFYQNMDRRKEQLMRTLGQGRDDRKLQELVMDLHTKIQSHPRPEAWLKEMRRGWETSVAGLTGSIYGQVVLSDVAMAAEYWAGQMERAVERMADAPAVQAAYGDQFLEEARAIRAMKGMLGRDWDTMSCVMPVFRKLRATKSCPESQRAKDIRDKCKKELKKIEAIFDIKEQEYIDDMQAMAPAMLALVDLTADFARAYREEKARRNVMDFADMEHFAIALLLDENDEPTELARHIAGRYREIMVDEYQDSNDVQDHIFAAVSREGKNVFMVGDVKQSIYRFRMADPTIFLRKYDTFAEAASAGEGEPRKVLLTQNFRSRREVLETVNFVFSRILSRQAGEMEYGGDERLYYGADYYLPRTGAETEYHLVSVEDDGENKRDRTAEEAAFVAGRIRALLDEGYPVQDDGAFRPCREEDIVILMRSPKSRMAAFSAALAERNILCSGEESSSLFDTPEVAVAFSFLQIIDNPHQDVPLLAAMRSALGGFSPDRLAAIRAGRRQGDFYEALCADDGEDSRAFLALLEGLRMAARELSADQVLWQLYDVGHAQAVFGAMPGGARRRQNLIAFYRFACEVTASGRRGLFDFVTYVREMMEQDKLPKLTSGGGGGVRIMSIHKSKGLEFPIVILCDLHKAFNTDDLKKMVLVHPQLGLGTVRIDEKRRIRYDTISKTAVAALLEKEAKAEEMRILYVAMTRAQEKLILVQCQRAAEKLVQDLCAVTDDPVPSQAVAEAKSMGQWILLPLLQTPEASVLRQFAGVNDLPMGGGCGWQVSLWHNAPTAEAAAEGGGEDAALALTADAAMMAWQYGHGAATTLPTKVTATELKGREWDEEIREEGAPRAYGGDFPRPKFLQETTALTATEKGTAMHLVMQYLDFAAGADTVAAQVADMASRRLLTQQQAEAVDCGAVERFLDTPLCDRIRRSGRVFREQRFNLLVDGTIFGADGAGEEIMLQGVVDCAFVEKGRLVIVDFKTDHVTVETMPGRAEHYRSQLEAYALALGRVLDLPVAEKVLYFFHTNSVINL